MGYAGYREMGKGGNDIKGVGRINSNKKPDKTQIQKTGKKLIIFL